MIIMAIVCKADTIIPGAPDHLLSNSRTKDLNPVLYQYQYYKIRNQLNRKKDQIFEFYFSSYDHFCTQNDPITHTHNSKNKYRRIFLVFFPFYTAHSTSFIKFPPFLRVGLHILNWEKAG